MVQEIVAEKPVLRSMLFNWVLVSLRILPDWAGWLVTIASGSGEGFLFPRDTSVSPIYLVLSGPTAGPWDLTGTVVLAVLKL